MDWEKIITEFKGELFDLERLIDDVINEMSLTSYDRLWLEDKGIRW